MLRLPELKADSARWHLPLFDRDAVQLLAALVSAERFERVANFNRLLRSSPSFLAWTICSARQWRRNRPKSTQEVARWLASHATCVLQWPAQPSRAGSSSAASRARWDDLTNRSLAVAEDAAAMARASTPADHSKRVPLEEAYLQGLLHAALDWMNSCGPKRSLPRGTQLTSPLPNWLTDLLCEIHQEHAVNGATGLVVNALSQYERSTKPPRPPSESSNESSDKDDRSGTELAELLPVLAAKLARLEQMEKEFQATLEREKLESLRELAYGASHEINNPLANISTRAQTLLREESDPERRRKLATINSQAFRAHEMISDMMLFVNPPDLSPGSFHAAELIDEVITELKTLASDQGTRVTWTPATPAPVIFGDRVQLAVALRSLCVNALEALGADGIIEIQARQAESSDASRESWVEIVVRDSGPGILPEQRRHMFDPFYSGREAGRGLGLGLSKCWRIVSLHGGRIDVESEPGRGTTFVIRLPQQADELHRAKGA
ncbi:MAG: sensor histidine kinase [Pirellulaceae bacterium]